MYFTSSVDETEITKFAAGNLQFGPNNLSIDDIRARFLSDAYFVLYGCNIGRYPKTMLTALKDLFQVSIVGFKTENVYCPPPQTIGSATFARKGEKIGVKKTGAAFDCKTDSTTDWRGLINDPNAVKVAKQRAAPRRLPTRPKHRALPPDRHREPAGGRRAQPCLA